MPIYIPKPDQQAAFFQGNLLPGEQVEGVFWCEQRLSLLLTFLLEQGGALAELVFSKFRHRYFVAVTHRRVLILGSTGWHDPIPEKFEAFERGVTHCAQYRNWLGHIAMDLQVMGEPEVRRYRVPRSQNHPRQAQIIQSI
jgi:hypothetical protein